MATPTSIDASLLPGSGHGHKEVTPSELLNSLDDRKLQEVVEVFTVPKSVVDRMMFGRVRLRDKDRLARSLGQLPPAGAVGASGAGAGASSNDVDGNSAGTHRTGLTSSYTSTGGSPKHGGGGKRTGRSRGTHQSGSSAMSGSKRTRGRGRRHKRGQSRDKAAGGSSTPRNDDAAGQGLGAQASPLLEMTATTHAVAGDLSMIGKTDRVFSRGTHCYMYSSAIGMTGKAYIRDPELQLTLTVWFGPLLQRELEEYSLAERQRVLNNVCKQVDSTLNSHQQACLRRLTHMNRSEVFDPDANGLRAIALFKAACKRALQPPQLLDLYKSTLRGLRAREREESLEAVARGVTNPIPDASAQQDGSTAKPSTEGGAASNTNTRNGAAYFDSLVAKKEAADAKARKAAMLANRARKATSPLRKQVEASGYATDWYKGPTRVGETLAQRTMDPLQIDHAAIFQSWQARGLVKSNNSFLQNMASPSPHMHLSSTLANNILPGSGIMLDTRPGARSKVSSSSAGTTPGSPKRSGGTTPASGLGSLPPASVITSGGGAGGNGGGRRRSSAQMNRAKRSSIEQVRAGVADSQQALTRARRRSAAHGDAMASPSAGGGSGSNRSGSPDDDDQGIAIEVDVPDKKYFDEPGDPKPRRPLSAHVDRGEIQTQLELIWSIFEMPFTMRVEHLMNSSETINAALDFRDVVNAWQVAALSVQHCVIIGELYEEARRRAVTDGHSVTVPTSKQRRNHSRGGDGVPTIAEGDEAGSEDSDAESVAPAVTTVHTSKDLGLLGEGKDDDPEYSKVMGLLRVPLVTPAATMIFLREHKIIGQDDPHPAPTAPVPELERWFLWLYRRIIAFTYNALHPIGQAALNDIAYKGRNVYDIMRNAAHKYAVRVTPLPT